MTQPLEDTPVWKLRAAHRLPDGRTAYFFSDALSLTPCEYAEWVMHPLTPKVDVVVHDKHGHSYFGKSPIWVPFAFWPIFIVLTLAYTGSGLHSSRLPSILSGILAWFVIEPLFHRFLFHLPVVGRKTQIIHLYLHGVHHLSPGDLDHVVSPIYELGAQAIAVATLLHFLGVSDVAAVMSGILLQYVRYDAVHYSVHAYTFKQLKSVPLLGGWLSRCKAQHREHHFVDATRNFAISYPAPW
eukprot:TRINITY_DN4048_c0_g1_i3.p1 TRINITY_DN4048_c0_g1~~TRINITY_DN4048_c0_g1_i3.p1  ORF type:complete len:241 (+),score=7.05 TRINITY_DN4048_c0_g1_i3:69-791(+)